MDSFELNKIAGAWLAALLVIMGVNSLASIVYAPDAPHAQAYIVEGLDEDAAVATIAADAEGGPSLAMLLASADAIAGEKVAKKCVACHTFDASGDNKVGPNLWNIIGHPVAEKTGFSYSSAMSEFGGAWEYERLDAFLQSPRKYLPGTKMSFAGLRKPKDRANVIAYMRGLSNDPAPLPQPEEEAQP